MINSQVQEHHCASGNEAVYEPKWRPDSCWSWLVCAASVISIVIVTGIGYSFGLLLPPLMENFQETRQATGNGSQNIHKCSRVTVTCHGQACKLYIQYSYRLFLQTSLFSLFLSFLKCQHLVTIQRQVTDKLINLL